MSDCYLRLILHSICREISLQCCYYMHEELTCLLSEPTHVDTSPLVMRNLIKIQDLLNINITGQGKDYKGTSRNKSAR